MEENKSKLEGGIVNSTLVDKASFESIPGNKEKKFYKVESSQGSFRGEPEYFIPFKDNDMSKPIRIAIQKIEEFNGTSMNFSSKEVTLDISVKLIVSRDVAEKYRTKTLDLDDLNKLIESRL